MTDEPQSPAFIGIEEALAKMLAKHKPSTPEEWDENVRKTEIWPALDRWGFPPRFRTLLKLNKPQAATLKAIDGKMIKKGAIVALVGIRGTGKTSIAARFAYERAKKNSDESRRTDAGRKEIVNVSYRKAAGLIARYKALYGDFGSIEIEGLTQSRDFYCEQMDFCVIDELHEAEESKWKNRILADILDRRYANMRDTLLISNQTPEEFKATTNDSILSRLAEHGAIIQCNWESYRTQK